MASQEEPAGMARPVGNVLRMLLYGLAPALALLTGSPALSVLRADEAGSGLVLLAAPFLLSLLSAPGYLHVAYSLPSKTCIGPGRRGWLRASMVLALVASLWGTWGAMQAVRVLWQSFLSGVALAPLTFSCLSAVAVVLLWREFERGPPQPRRAPVSA